MTTEIFSRTRTFLGIGSGVLLALGVVGSWTAPSGGGPAIAGPTLIRGSISDDATGEPLTGAGVVAFILPTEEETRRHPELWGRTARLELAVDGEGRFEARVPPSHEEGGLIAIVAQARGHAEWRRLQWGHEEERALPFRRGDAIEVPIRMRRGKTLEGTVTDENGRPVEGARVKLTLSGPGWCSWPQAFSVGPHNWPPPTATDAAGRWEILGFPFEAIERDPAAHWVLTVEHDSLAPAVVQRVESLPAKQGVVEIAVRLPRGVSSEGEVLRQGGGPVAGARIVATGPARTDEPICVVIQKTARAGSDGRYVLAGLDRREWQVRARAAGFAPSEEMPLRVGASPPGELRFTLQPGHELRSRLLDDEGRPVEGVEVHFHMKKGRLHDSAVTDPDGWFVFTDIPRGDAVLSASGLFEKEVGVPSGPLELRLEPRRELVVVLRAAEDGKALRPPAHVSFSGPGMSGRVTLEREDGRMSLGRLAPAEYRLYADVPGRALLTRTTRLGPGKGIEEVTLDVPRGFALRGHVADRAGRPIPAAVVRAIGSGPYGERSATVDAAGCYELQGLSSDRYIVGSAYLLVASADGYATNVNLESFVRFWPYDRTLDFTLVRGGTVRGRVLNTDGTPAAGRLVKVLYERRLFRALLPLPSSVTDAEGRYALEHVPVGRVVVVVEDKKQSLDVRDGEELTLDWRLGTSP